MPKPTIKVKLICDRCYKYFYLINWRWRQHLKGNHKNIYCSKKCHCPNYKKGITINSGYYRRTDTGKYIHVEKIEKKIGRMLFKKEKVHHKNGNKLDNRLNNLILCQDQSEHAQYHTSKGRQGFQSV